MPDLLLRDCRLSTAPPGAPLADVRVRDGRIGEIGRGLTPTGEPELDLAGRLLAPGLIDLHIHGAGGADVLDGTEEALRTVSTTLARMGVTGFLATTVMRPGEGSAHLQAAARAVGTRLGGARLLGIHLEGPFVNPERKGGLPVEGIYPSTREALEEVLGLTVGALRMMTIAPEMPGNLAAIERLSAEGVIPSFGHSAATYEETLAGISAGIRHATHLYNAMPGLHHREPGPLIALHETDDLTVQIVSDGVHVDGRVARFTRAAFGAERCIPITDGMRTVGLPDGLYRFGDRDFESRGGAARYTDGTLIGTSLGLLDVVRRWRDFTGCTLVEAMGAASRLPARLLGRSAGVLETGADADLVALDADETAWATVVAGEVVHGPTI